MSHELWTDPRPEAYGHGSEGGGGGWQGLTQAVLIRTTREYLSDPARAPVVEDHFYLTNIPVDHKDGTPAALLGIARNHWEIENGLHCVKDKTMREDACRCKKSNYALSWMRNLAVFMLQYVAGESVPQKQLRIQARPSIAKRLISIRRKPRKLLGADL